MELCNKCKHALHEDSGTATCSICQKTYRRCKDCGGQPGADRSLTAHAGLLHAGQGAGPRQAQQRLQDRPQTRLRGIP